MNGQCERNNCPLARPLPLRNNLLRVVSVPDDEFVFVDDRVALPPLELNERSRNVVGDDDEDAHELKLADGVKPNIS